MPRRRELRITGRRGAWDVAAGSEDHMDLLLQGLLRQAYLFDDPSAYEAGVRDAFEALRADAARPEEEAA